MYEMMEDLWRHIISEIECGSKRKDYEITCTFVLNDPPGRLHVSHDSVVTGEEADKDAVGAMAPAGDTTHAFRLKRIGLPAAAGPLKLDPLPFHLFGFVGGELKEV